MPDGVGQWDKSSTHAPICMLVTNLGGMDLLAMSKTRVVGFTRVEKVEVREGVSEASPGRAMITKDAFPQE